MTPEDLATLQALVDMRFNVMLIFAPNRTVIDVYSPYNNRYIRHEVLERVDIGTMLQQTASEVIATMVTK